jgi:ribosomal protein S18 acetylase RimI-like enzyme
MRFRAIDVQKDRDTMVAFRKDSYAVSFGNVDRFGDEEAYIKRIEERVSRFPDGVVLVEENGKAIGQMELQITTYGDRVIGYVNLYYLIPEYRGKGYGQQLLEYAEQFFRKHAVNEYHLRVSPTNQRAVRFYLKNGMTKLKEEQHTHLVWRMRKELLYT